MVGKRRTFEVYRVGEEEKIDWERKKRRRDRRGERRYTDRI
jgi:hypothetical protein